MNRKKLIMALVASICLTGGVAAFTACGDSGKGNSNPPSVEVPDSPAVTFDYNIADGPESETVYSSLSGGKYYVVAPVPPEVPGYKFAGWYYDSEFTNPFDYFNDEITENITVYAKWVDAVAVTYVYNIDGMAPVKVNAAEDGGAYYAERPSADPSAQGYVFVGWYADSSYSAAFDFSQEITSSVSVYARWQAVAEGKNVVKVVDQDGAPLAGVYVMIKYYDVAHSVTVTVSDSKGNALSLASDANGFVIFPEFTKIAGVIYQACISDYGSTSSQRAYPYGYAIGETGTLFNSSLFATVSLNESASFYDNQCTDINYDRAWVLVPNGNGLDDGYPVAGKKVTLNEDGTLASSTGTVDNENEDNEYVELLYRVEAGRYYYFSFCPYVNPADITDNDKDNTTRIYNAMVASTGIYEISFVAQEGNVRASLFEGSGLITTDENGIPTNTISITGTAPANTPIAERAKYTGTDAITIDYNSDQASSAKYFFVTADEDGFITIKVRRTADARIREYVSETVEIDENAVQCDYVKTDKEELRNVEVDGSVIAVLGDDGYYHIGSADGAILYAQLDNPVARVATVGIFHIHEDDNGLKQGAYTLTYTQDTDEQLKTYSFNYYNAVLSYLNLVNEDGVYPVNEQLKDILSFLCINASGIGEAASGCEWMLACQYYETIRDPFTGTISADTPTDIYAASNKAATLTVDQLTEGYYILTASGNTVIDGSASGDVSVTVSVNGGSPLKIGGLLGTEGNQEIASYSGVIYVKTGDVISVTTSSANDVDFRLTLTSAQAYTLTDSEAVTVSASQDRTAVLVIGDVSGTFALTASNNSNITSALLEITFTYPGGTSFTMSGYYGYQYNIAVTPGMTLMFKTNGAATSFDLALNPAGTDSDGVNGELKTGTNTVTLSQGYTPYSFTFNADDGYYKITVPENILVYLSTSSATNIIVTDNGDGTYSGIFAVTGGSATLILNAYITTANLTPFTVSIATSEPVENKLGVGEDNGIGVEIAYQTTEIELADGVSGSYIIKISPSASMINSMQSVKIVAYIDDVQVTLINEAYPDDSGEVQYSLWVVGTVDLNENSKLTIGLVSSSGGSTTVSGYVTVTLTEAV